jgi:hypothetical protein
MVAVLLADTEQVRSGGPGWRVLEIFEFFAYPLSASPCMQKLVIVVARNESPVERWLDVVHRGTASCEPALACPLPEFPPADEHGRVRVARALRRQMRSADNVPQFRPRASRYDLARTWVNVSPWVPRADGTADYYLPYCGQALDRRSCRRLPFTTLRVGPFAPSHVHVLAVRVELAGETFRYLVGDRFQGSIDGPDLLLSCIEHEDIRNGQEDSRLAGPGIPWSSELSRIRGNLLRPGYHDLFVVGPPVSRSFRYASASPSLSQIVDGDVDDAGAPHHFVTDSTNFSLALRFEPLEARIPSTAARNLLHEVSASQ